jgi:hypothetical protein
VLWFVLLALLFVAWVISLFLLVLDSISVGAKVVWFVALTVLAPIAIPAYLVLRWRRRAPERLPAAGS